jgi:uncharacterized membrane protein (DUF106 family)
MSEYEGEDRRVSQFSNIQHPFFFKPEFIMAILTSSVIGAIGVTLWITSEIGAVEAIAVDNRSEIGHVKEIQQEAHNNMDKQVEEIKDSQKEMKQDMKEGFKDIGGKIDKLIDRELKKNGNH